MPMSKESQAIMEFRSHEFLRDWRRVQVDSPVSDRYVKHFYETGYRAGYREAETELEMKDLEIRACKQINEELRELLNKQNPIGPVM